MWFPDHYLLENDLRGIYIPLNHSNQSGYRQVDNKRNTYKVFMIIRKLFTQHFSTVIKSLFCLDFNIDFFSIFGMSIIIKIKDKTLISLYIIRSLKYIDFLHFRIISSLAIVILWSVA